MIEQALIRLLKNVGHVSNVTETDRKRRENRATHTLKRVTRKIQRALMPTGQDQIEYRQFSQWGLS